MSARITNNNYMSALEGTPEPVRSPRHTRVQRTTLAGLDQNLEDGDEEYNEDLDDAAAKDGADDDDEDPDEDEDNDDEDQDDDQDEDEDQDEDQEDQEDQEEHDEDEEHGNETADLDIDAEGKEPAGPADAVAEPEPEVPVKKKRGRKRKHPLPEPTEGTGEDGDKPVVKKGKKRGRKPKRPRPDDVFYDDKGNEINVQNDEVVVENEDPKGLEKIDENGILQGDRKFRIKTFTLLGKGDRQYMVSTEPARLVGFRDSYLLFKTHQLLFKKVCTHEEKMDLIDRHVIPTSYKGRSVNLVTARSIYREFGARMVVNGKKVIDDFWEEQARERGDVEGEYADPEETSGKPGQYGPDHNAFLAQVTGSALINYQADPTWMYQVALQTVEFNKSLSEARNQVWLRGVRDSYSGFNFYPTASQPTRARLVKVAPAEDGKTFDCAINIAYPDLRKVVTGLASVPPEIFEELDDETKQAVLEQQRFERSV